MDRVAVISWCQYTPDCPADLEVTSDTIIGIYDADDPDLLEKLNQTIQAYKDKETDDKSGLNEDEIAEALADFESYFDGYFQTVTIPINRPLPRASYPANLPQAPR